MRQTAPCGAAIGHWVTDMEEKIRFMKEALRRAKKGLAQGEVPVGAVVVCEGKIVGSGYNRRTKTQMASSHAEMYAIDRACKKLNPASRTIAP